MSAAVLMTGGGSFARDARRRELEMLLLTMIAAAPLYLTSAVAKPLLLLFHVMMTGIALRVWRGRGPELVAAPLMRGLAIALIPFYIIDAALISRSAIGASTHLVLFIAIYQPMESVRQPNHAQRMLTSALIFIASLGTSTHIAVVPFVILFAFLSFRQLIFLSHEETKRSLELTTLSAPAPASRPAIFYLVGTLAIGAALFPFLPRLRNPFIRGGLGGLSNATTGLSDSINFNEPRTATNDSTVVARVWMDPLTAQLYSPLRLRGAVYDRVANNRWMQTRGAVRGIPARGGVFRLARPIGRSHTAVVEQRFGVGAQRLYLPVGTHAVSGVANLTEGPSRESFHTFYSRGNPVQYEVKMARRLEPLLARRIPPSGFPVTPAIAAMARGIAGGATNVEEQAGRIELYLLRNFQYVADPASIGKTMTVEDFLLRERRGHCEYFAAGMVGLMAALDVPARIAGGFYGGQFNPMGGYFIVRREDAHAWVEVWNGSEWKTFDPTPPSLRPGMKGGATLRVYISALGDSINYFWDRYVLTYGFGDQIALFSETIARFRRMASALRPGGAGGFSLLSKMTVSIAGAVIAAVLVFFLVLSRRTTLFDLLAAHLRRLGIEVGKSMTMEDALRVLRERHPEAAAELEPLIAAYEAERFSPTRDRTRAAMIRRKLAELRA
jgi:transglutaminase-like putative cysteine protease